MKLDNEMIKEYISQIYTYDFLPKSHLKLYKKPTTSLKNIGLNLLWIVEKKIVF
ncbi:hypothetical protein RC62_627 [Flavobacterium aquidurense]|uniref:Uncharacterized protein n=1 Tax=Flavobacterium aquidurense TaxID=362413 RepID=A0A0Q0S8F7_9FLAO|nr:hypothetical protein RC62_627 [Flavobacterium aquidurense]